MRDGLPDLVQVWLAAAAAFAGREDFLFPEPQISCSKVMPHPLALSPDPPRRASRDEMEDFERPNEEERETSLVIVVQQRTHLKARTVTFSEAFSEARPVGEMRTGMA